MISIITPTYNRGYILENLYISLKNQSVNNFEWIVIDDGSKDNTREIVNSWMTESNSFNIRYFYKKNGGKHRALNYGIPKAEGDFIFIVDSDDYLVNNAIELAYQWIETIASDDSFAGVSGLRGYPNGEIIGEFPKGKKYVDAKNSCRRKMNLEGDKAEVYRKDLLLKYPFPEFEGEKFITESTAWNRLSIEGYKVRWFGEIIYIGEYLEDGLSHNIKDITLKNFQGLKYSSLINRKAFQFPFNYNSVAYFMEVARKKGYDSRRIMEEMEINSFEYLIALSINLVRHIREYYKKK